MRTVTTIMLCVLLVATSFVVGCSGEGGGSEGLGAPIQAIGDHSVWYGVTGYPPDWDRIRDDELTEYICNAIPKDDDGAPLIKDVVIMMNSCYGGGFADDFQRAFGIRGMEGRNCWGVPWIFASACSADESAWGYKDCDLTTIWKFGSYWTNALAHSISWTNADPTDLQYGPPGSIRDRTSDNVLTDFESARELDWANPANDEEKREEHGVIAYNNGGESIVWNAADTKHEALVFGGRATDERHTNNVNNIETALDIVWEGSPHTITKIAEASIEDFLDAIDDACSRLDKDTQLVLYFDDHGGPNVDEDEKEAWLAPRRIDAPLYRYTGPIAVPSFWEGALIDQHRQGEDPSPSITLGLVEPIVPEEWIVSFNGIPLAWPAPTLALTLALTDEVELAVNWTTIHAGNNTLEIQAVGEPSGPMVLDNLELCAGPINDGEYLFNPMVAAGGWHTVGQKLDGTVVAVGFNGFGQCDVGAWTDIIEVDAGLYHTVGLKLGGTVVAAGSNDDGRCDVAGWTDMIQVTAGEDHTVGLKSDGNVVAVGNNDHGECNVGNWTDIVQVSGGDDHTVGLRSNGTVVAVGRNDQGQCDVGGWTGIVQIAAGGLHTVGLKSDGTAIAVGFNYSGQCDIAGWTGIVQIAAGAAQTVGLRSDGTVVAVGVNDEGQCDVGGWTHIVQVASGRGGWHTVGLKSDGTVVVVGDNSFGQCDVTGWDLIP